MIQGLIFPNNPAGGGGTGVSGHEVKGAYDAATNTPDLDTAPAAGSISQGDAYTVSVAGLFFTEAVESGDLLIADQDNPTALSHWTRVNKNIGAAITQKFSPSAGQVTFILVAAPTDISTFTLSVNGVEAEIVTDYTVSGVTITWLNTEFSMETTDLVVARYR